TYLTRMCLSDTTVFLPDHNLTYMDKATMAAGVETRPPLVDHRIVQLAFRLKDGQRIRGTRQKALLRHVASRWVPRRIVRRAKSPFSAPLRAWIRHDLREMVDDLLSPRALKARGMYRPEEIQRLVQEDRRGQEDHSHVIWKLLCRELWLRTFIDRSATRRSEVAAGQGLAPAPEVPVLGDPMFRVITPPKPKLLAIVQLPPPVHGVTVMNQTVVNSSALQRSFDLEVLPLRFATSSADVGRLRARKVLTALDVFFMLAFRCARRRPRLAYFTLVPVGGAFYRDLFFVALLKLFRIPRVFHLHGKGVRAAARSRLNRVLYRWVFGSGAVVHLTRGLLSDISEFVPQDRCRVLPNGVRDPGTVVRPGDQDGGTGGMRLLYVSNMKVSKGPIVLLEALAELRRRGFAFSATFAGAWADRDCLGLFGSTLSQAGLDDCVMHVGPVHGTQKDELMRQSDIFVFPTFYAPECFPLVILEAMSFGLPVVSTLEGGIPDIVKDGVTGILVPQQDVKSLSDALESLMTRPDLRARMGQK